jgi:hypothetical protein
LPDRKIAPMSAMAVRRVSASAAPSTLRPLSGGAPGTAIEPSSLIWRTISPPAACAVSVSVPILTGMVSPVRRFLTVPSCSTLATFCCLKEMVPSAVTEGPSFQVGWPPAAAGGAATSVLPSAWILKIGLVPS